MSTGTNCLRGGFICQGYPNQRGYQKMENKPSAVPLESKDPSYVPPGAYGMPQQPPYGNNQVSAPARRDPPSYRGQPLRIDPPQGRLLTDDDRPTASTIQTASGTSPDNKLSALSAFSTNPANNVFPTPISAISSATTNFGERGGLQKEYARIPPLHDPTRTGEPETPHPGNSLPQINILHPTRTSSPANPPPQTTSAAQVAAQLALSHNRYSPGPPRGPTQKEMMLRGEMYKPFDKELVLERERCSAACWRFNNSTNPNNGVSGAERARLFREILMPKEPINISPLQLSPVSNVGRAGTDCVVEAPFTCDYGYNITIGHSVFIGRNCTILDACSVKIGNNAYIGPNVSLFAATLKTDPTQRMGSKSSQVGKPIIIEDDVFIGGGAIILPGLRIGKGSTVAAGAVVTHVRRRSQL
jgi:acetyltransferase-like isoleucine patch superfamily enzyme